ncbi:MAG: hypothetical protein HZA91_00750 [Verrucomicrobia bacterium]|nr:hypothetical protein [Verrucomicrobiota bacterium]
MKRWLLLVGTVATIAAWAQTNAPAPSGTPASTNAPAAAMAPEAGSVKGFMVPEYDETGQLRWKMFGDTARVLLTGGKVEVHVMKIEVYRGNAVDMTMRSPVCLFDRAAKLATSDRAVEIVATNMTVTGIGFDWNAADSVVKIRNDVTVTLQNRQGSVFLPLKSQPQ